MEIRFVHEWDADPSAHDIYISVGALDTSVTKCIVSYLRKITARKVSLVFRETNGVFKLRDKNKIVFMCVWEEREWFAEKKQKAFCLLRKLRKQIWGWSCCTGKTGKKTQTTEILQRFYNNI